VHEPRGEWGERRLCSNGACIGVMGDDGRCKVCGRAATDAAGDPTTAAPAPAPPVSEPAPASASEPAAAITASPELEAPAPTAEAAAADPERCADTSCSGAIGANGRCEVCGKGAS
jgi:hypothetical protein